MNKLAFSLFGMFLNNKKEAAVSDTWTVNIPKKLGKNLAMMGLGGYAGWKANSAIQDWALGNQIRKQQGQ